MTDTTITKMTPISAKASGCLAWPWLGRGGVGKIIAAGLLGLIFLNLGSSPAVAQSNELQPVLDRLKRMERDIRTLNIRLSRGPQSGGVATPAPLSGGSEDTAARAAGVARVDTRMDQLEADLRSNTGKIENMTFQMQRINQRLEKLVADIDYRLSAIENSRGGQASPSQAKAVAPQGRQEAAPGATQAGILGTLKSSDLNAQPPVAVLETPRKPVSVLPPGGPKVRYKYAFSLLRQAEYSRAEAAFLEFIKLYSDDPLTSNARYWLGETYYVRGRYVKAAEVFLAAYQGDDKGAKAPDTLLKLGMSLGNLDKKTQACASFDKLLTDFPKASPSILAKVKSEQQKNGCK